MGNYLNFLNQGSSKRTFSRKTDYIKYNFKKYIKLNNNKEFSVLEIGPGLGEAVKYFNDRGIKKIDVVDNDEMVLNYIGSIFNIRKKILANQLDEIESLLDSYDVIIATQVLEHITKDKHYAFLKTLYMHLKRGGYIIITAPNMANPFTSFERYGDITHEIGFTDNSFRQLAIKCDIPQTMIEINGFNIPPYTPLNILRIVFQKIFHFIMLILSIINGGGYSMILTPNITLIVKK